MNKYFRILGAVFVSAVTSTAAFGYTHCDCSGMCGEQFSANAWSEQNTEQNARVGCFNELNDVCTSNGFQGIIASTVRTTCDGPGGNPNPPPPPPPPPASNSVYQCTVNLMTLQGVRAKFYGRGYTQNDAIGSATSQCASAISGPQEICQFEGCIL